MSPVKTFVWPLVAAIAIAGGSYLGTIEMNQHVFADAVAQTARPTPTPKVDGSSNSVNDLSLAFRSVHNSMKNAVVNIHVIMKRTADAEQSNNGLPEGFQLPKGFEMPPGLRIAPDEKRVEEGTGSGVIVSPDGYILTNNHVVQDATDIAVTLEDGREFKATVVGTDPKTDLAVVRIKADHLTYAKFGDSDALQVGDWVLAFGSPLGFSHTMTQGIISAKGRQIGIMAEHNPALRGLTYENFLQTDAAINPGNSGGPLVDLAGEVVGINAAIASNTGQYNGIGFAIPSNDADYIMNSLIKNGKVVRGYLSVEIEDFAHPAPQDQGLVDSIHKEGYNGNGVLVERLNPDGPAGKGGVLSGDVITELNDKPVESLGALRNAIARTAPGTNVKLDVYRDGKTVDLSFPVGTQPDENPEFAEAGNGNPEHAAPMDNQELGVSVKALDSSLAAKYKLKEGRGVIITEVTPDSLAAQLGLQPGDVITRVGKTAVTSPEQFKEEISKAKLSAGVRINIRSADGMDRTAFLMKR